VTAFTGDKLYLVDQSLPTKERVDAAVKRVQKLTSASKVAILPGGAEGNSCGGKKDAGKRKSNKALQQLQQQHQQAQQLMFPPGFEGGFGNGRGNGPPNGDLPLMCFNCGLPGHISANCPKTKK